MKHYTKKNTFTTKQLQYLGVCERAIRACQIKNIVGCKDWLIWHQGRNSWVVYERK
ncbi:hypothetical protein [Calothrix rhizosoleniae]|uniref:hypothetical protein n=1 Tax=Calothrix rhizosoleniae TaxID=888997 RepID=UPI0013565F17|nr:hypothetical protein [Calothrix rhizosoleniae]